MYEKIKPNFKATCVPGYLEHWLEASAGQHTAGVVREQRAPLRQVRPIAADSTCSRSWRLPKRPVREPGLGPGHSCLLGLAAASCHGLQVRIVCLVISHKLLARQLAQLAPQATCTATSAKLPLSAPVRGN